MSILSVDDFEEQRELSEQTQQLDRTVQELRTLCGKICICAKCKRVKTSTGLWQRLEDFLEEKLNAKLTSGVCNRCGG